MELYISAAQAAGVLLLGLAAILLSVRIGDLSRTIGEGLADVADSLGGSPCSRSPSSAGDDGGEAIFVYRADRGWDLESDFSSPGYEPVPPRLEGSYDHQVVRTASRPALKG